MTADEVFEKTGFVGEYRSEFEAFYRRFFENESDLNDFFYSVFQNDIADKKPRWMMNHILHFVSLANDIDKIRPARDPLRIMFLRICLESLCKISDSDTKNFFNSFDRFFSDSGKQYILSNFVFSGISIPDELNDMEKAKFETHERYKLTIADFLTIIRATRNMLVHDGDYWTMQFFARDNDSQWLTDMTTDDDMISCQPREKGKKLTYCFITTMQYEQFEYYFVEACINYLKDYIEKHEK